MNKSILVIAVGMCLAGCDKKVEEKPVSELTHEEQVGLCSNPAVVKTITDGFKAETVKNLDASPINYYPLINAKQDEPEYKYKDSPFLYTSKFFEDGFGTTERLKVDKITVTGTRSDSINCEATVTLDSDSLYKRNISGPMSYQLVKQGDKYTPKVPEFGIVNLRFSMSDEPTNEQTAWRNGFFENLSAIDNKTKSIPNDSFIPVSQDDLYYIYFSQATREFSDDELMSFFSGKWNSTTDSFAKEDLKKDELPVIKAKIAKYKDIHNIVFYASSNYGYNNNPDIPDFKTASDERVFNLNDGALTLLAGESYNFDIKGYKYSGIGCGMVSGRSYSNRGITVSIPRRLNACNIVIPDDKARDISSALSSIHSKQKNVEYFDKYYLHIDKVDGDSNIISTALVREELKIYDPENHQVIIETTIK